MTYVIMSSMTVTRPIVPEFQKTKFVGAPKWWKLHRWAWYGLLWYGGRARFVRDERQLPHSKGVVSASEA